MVFLLFCFLILMLNGDPLFTTKGSKIYKNGNWIVFNGIGLTCTEYMMKPGIDSSVGAYPGQWAHDQCFGGPSSNNGPIELNAEPANVLSLLTEPNFVSNPTITKISMETDYNQVISLTESPMRHPIIRIPTSGSTYLYDADCDTGNHLSYVNTLDAIIKYFTSNNVSVSFDLHWNCPDQTTLSGCPNAQTAPMATTNFGPNPGAVEFWGNVSAKYGDNEYVFYELFNEPYLKNGADSFNTYYNGDNTYAGMKQMYDRIRSNAPNSLIIMAGMQSYAYDATSLIAFSLQYYNDNKEYPTNLLFNFHPYQGGGQGNEKAPQAALRELLAGKTIAPVIITEFGQYCCGTNSKECTGGGNCASPNTGPNFVFNIVNMALEYDLSWIGWAWRGTNSDSCTNHEPVCSGPDMRGAGYPNATLTDGTWGGANWFHIWETFMSSSDVKVIDALGNGKSFLTPNEKEVQGFLPRPCIMGDYNIANNCGWDLNTNIEELNVSAFNGQTLYYAYLPGLPPQGNCSNQGCPGYPCNAHPVCQPY